MGIVLKEKSGLKYLTIQSFEKSGLTVHGFSLKPINNLEGFSQFLNVNPRDLTQAEQIHGSSIAIIDKNKKGKIAYGCDALLTNSPGIPLVIRTADCVPIFLLDPKTKTIGLVHSGWKGTIQNIAGKTIQTMKEVFNANPSDILVGIAPSIGPCCYEIKKDVIDMFKEFKEDWKNFVTTGKEDKLYLNLRELNMSQLVRAGVPKINITINNNCTSCDANSFFSYRRDGKGTGRMFSIIMIK